MKPLWKILFSLCFTFVANLSSVFPVTADHLLGVDDYSEIDNVNDSDNDNDNDHDVGQDSDDYCGLWVAPSSISNAGLGVFNGGRPVPSGVNYGLDQDQLAIPMVDIEFHNDNFRGAPKHLRKNWRDYLMDFFISTSDFALNHNFPPDTHMLISGTGALVDCHFALNNVQEPDKLEIDTLNMHRSTHAGVGAFSPYHGYHAPTIKAIPPYAEVFGSYGHDWFLNRRMTIGYVPFEQDWKSAQEFLDNYKHLYLQYGGTLITDAMWADLWKLVAPDQTMPYDSFIEAFFQTHSPNSTSVDVLVIIIKSLLDLTGPQSKALPTTWNDTLHAMELGSLEQYELEKSTRTLEWLQTHGRCMDGLRPGNSSIPQAGRGAFARKYFKTGDVVAHAPLLHVVDRSILNVYNILRPPHELEGHWQEKRNPLSIRGSQLLVNYCFGRDPNESTLLLCPYGSNTFYINHHSTDYNVKIAWATNTSWFDPKCLEMTPVELGLHFKTCLAIDYIALRDIAPDEEILIDYGIEWQQAWQHHLDTWKPHPTWATTHPPYVRATDLNKDMEGPLRTLAEEGDNPYSGNIHIECWHPIQQEWFSCDVMSRTETDNGVYEYVVDLDIRFPAIPEEGEEFEDDDGSEKSDQDESDNNNNNNNNEDEEQEDEEEEEQVEESQGENYFERFEKFPRKSIRFLDEWYSGDEFLPNAFRHEMRLPDDLFSESWKHDPSETLENSLNNEVAVECDLNNSTDSNQVCGWNNNPYDFVSSPHLQPGQMEPIRWSDTGDVVNRYSARVGLDLRLPQELLAFAERLGIIDLFWKLLQQGEPLQPGSFEMIHFQHDENLQFYVNRPDKQWKSNMHWVNAANEYTHEEYIKVLASGNFDQTLNAIGDFFGLDGLFIQGVSFIGVSHCEQGYVHQDMSKTGGKFFNVLFPLVLAEDAPPEFILRDDISFREGRAKYIPNEAMIVGDDAYHGTAACDYLSNKSGIRVSASIYIADVNADNIDEIVSDTTTIFPIPFDKDWVIASRGRHWGTTGSLASDMGRKPLIPRDTWTNCAELASEGACDTDIWEMRANCVKTCKVFVEESHFTQFKQR